MNIPHELIPSRGDVVIVNLDPSVGHEPGGLRPALVISSDDLNRSPARLVIVVPITGTDRGIPAHIRVSSPEGGLTKPSVIMADQVRTISRRRVARRLGTVSSATMRNVENCLKLVFDLN
jgi:mRNA interferase MazF